MVGSNPAGRWAFSLLLYFLAFYLRVSFIKEVHLYEMGKFKKEDAAFAFFPRLCLLKPVFAPGSLAKVIFYFPSQWEFFPNTLKYSN